MPKRVTPLDLQDEARALSVSLHGATDAHTGFVLILYRRRLDGTEEVAMGSSLLDEPGAFRTCAKLLDEHSRGEIPARTVDVPKAGEA